MTEDFKKYQDVDAVNPSSLKILHQYSPAHYLYSLTHERTETPAMKAGTAIHTAILEPERYDETYAVRPEGLDGHTKDGRSWLAETSAAGKIILTQAEAESIGGMQQTILARPESARYLAPGAIETPIYWTDPETGIACKGRPDLVTDSGVLVDLKKAVAIAHRRFTRAVLDYGYLFSMAMYYDGLTILGREPQETVLYAVEPSAPYDTAIWILPDEALDLGREQYRQALRRLAECRASDRWPGQVPTPTVLTLPSWAWPDDEDVEGLIFDEEAHDE